jgi:hypothetical protein
LPRTGRGVDTIYYGQLRYGRPLPRYEVTSASVTVTLPGSSANHAFVRWLVSEGSVGRDWSLADLLAVRAIAEARNLSAEETAVALQSDAERARNVLARLVDAGILEARGEGRGRTYHLSAAMYRVLGDRPGYYVRVRGFEPAQQEQMVLKYAQEHGQITRREPLSCASSRLTRPAACCGDWQPGTPSCASKASAEVPATSGKVRSVHRRSTRQREEEMSGNARVMRARISICATYTRSAEALDRRPVGEFYAGLSAKAIVSAHLLATATEDAHGELSPLASGSEELRKALSGRRCGAAGVGSISISICCLNFHRLGDAQRAGVMSAETGRSPARENTAE